jgi:hypothetical protein
MSTLWRMDTYEVGGDAAFKSEYEMETFLMLNPSVLNCQGDDGQEPLLWQQIGVSQKTKRGRIDLMGIDQSTEEGTLKIFELKNSKIEKGAVDQLDGYIETLRSGGQRAEKIKEKLLELWPTGKDRGEKYIEKLVKNAEGVLVGTGIELEKGEAEVNIDKIKTKNISVIKLSNFYDTANSSRYIVAEDLVGKTVKKGKIKQFSWDEVHLNSTEELLLELQKEVREDPWYYNRMKEVKEYCDKYYNVFTGICLKIEKLKKSDFCLSGPYYSLTYGGQTLTRHYIRSKSLKGADKFTFELEKNKVGESDRAILEKHLDIVWKRKKT